MRRKHIPITVMAALLAAALNAQVEFKPRAKRKTQGTRSSKADALRLGNRLPEHFALDDLSGQRHEFRRYRGKMVLLLFWSRDCPIMARHQQAANELAARYREREEVIPLLINANQDEIGGLGSDAGSRRARQGLRREARRRGIREPILIDPGNKASRFLQARTTPQAFVFDSTGRLRYAGALSDDPQGRKGSAARCYPADAIDALLAGNEVGIPASKPWGRAIRTEAPRRRARARRTGSDFDPSAD